MEELLKQMIGQMNKQFEKIDQRFDAMDKRFEAIDQRFDRIEHRLDNIEARLDNIEVRIDNIEVRLDAVETSIVSLKETVENNAIEFRSHFTHIETKLDGHDMVFEIIADEMKFDLKPLRKKIGIDKN